MNLAEYLLANADAAATALIEPQASTSYGRLRDEAGRIASGLLAAGGRTGDRVLLISENSAFWAEAYLGILAAGLCAVPLPPKSEAEAVRQIAASASPRFVLLQARLWPRFASALPDVPLFTDTPLRSEIGRTTAVAALPPAAFQCQAVREDAALAGLFFTSGSTGVPRGVMVTHRNIIANTRSILAYLPLQRGDSILQILPMHYCFGTSLLHTHLRAGAAVVIENGFQFPEKVLDRMAALGCTGFAGVPANYQILLRNSRFGRQPLPSLRYMLQAGGKLADEFIDQVRAAQPQAKLYVMYGQTEATARLSYLPPDALSSKRGSIGRGIPGVTLRIIREDGQEAAAGEVGQIVAEGENISPGYWQAPEESAEVFREGRLYTGDLARKDADGFITIVGRSRDFIKLGGTRVAAQQLERTALTFEGCIDAAVVGVADPLLGEAAVYFLVHPSGEAVREAFLEHCKAALPPAHWPRELTFLPDLPRTASGKPDRPRLRELAARAVAANEVAPAAATA